MAEDVNQQMSDAEMDALAAELTSDRPPESRGDAPEPAPEPAPVPSEPSEPTDSGEVVPPLPDFSRDLAEAAASSIELLKDVELDVKIELGRVDMSVGEILQLSNGSVVELDKLAGDPVDVLVNAQLVAHGEVLVINDSFCVRINEIAAGITEKFEKM